MRLQNTHTTRRVLQWATISLGTLSLAIVAYGFTENTSNTLQGMFLPNNVRKPTPWLTISAEKIVTGTSIPASTHVIIHIPEEVTRITRRVLFGKSGETVRYWGYCLPHNADEGYRNTRRTGLPGDLFFSEAEREHRRQKLITERRRTFSIFKNLTMNDLNETKSAPASKLRHMIEVFEGGTTCYVMTERSIPIGTDADDDILNSALERAHGTDPNNPDTDSDGISDGFEVLRMQSLPTMRDSDGDKLIDGKEDANRNGVFDVGETSPIKWDTDGDGLCDGYCLVNKGQDLRGEDKNLNGIYEPEKGEYDPRRKDSDGDGILDDHEVYLCVINGGDDC